MMRFHPIAGTVDFLRSLEMSDDELSKAIIGTIGDVDAYQLPGACDCWVLPFASLPN